MFPMEEQAARYIYCVKYRIIMGDVVPYYSIRRTRVGMMEVLVVVPGS
jgi:hypothetical protein